MGKQIDGLHMSYSLIAGDLVGNAARHALVIVSFVS